MKWSSDFRQVCWVMAKPSRPAESRWTTTPLAERESQFAAKIEAFQCFADDVVYAHFAKVMTSFHPGLFAGADMTSHPRDNLDLERWFRSPKSHRNSDTVSCGKAARKKRLILPKELERRILETGS